MNKDKKQKFDAGRCRSTGNLDVSKNMKSMETDILH